MFLRLGVLVVFAGIRSWFVIWLFLRLGVWLLGLGFLELVLVLVGRLMIKGGCRLAGVLIDCWVFRYGSYVSRWGDVGRSWSPGWGIW